MVLDGIRLDLISALRVLRSHPAFAAVAVLTLAIGIGGATAMFSVVNGVLLRPLPVRDQSSVAVLSMRDRRNASAHLPIRYSTFKQLCDASHTFAGVANVHMIGASMWLVTDRDRLVQMDGALVSGNLFEVLGVSPVLGRTLTAEDDVPGAPNVAVLSYAAWHRDFGGDSAVIGRSLGIFGRLYTLVGVMPDGLEFPRGAQLWAPIVAFDPALLSDGAAGSLDLVGRLRPGATLEAAQAELLAIVRRDPVDGSDRVIAAARLADAIVGDMRGRLLVLSLAVGLVLLIACGNVATLMLSRGGGRAREVAVRNALGATAWRIVRQLLTEAVVLAMLGGVVGLIVASGLLWMLLAAAPTTLPRLGEVRIDLISVLFAATASTVAVVLSGLAPATTAIRSDTVAVLKGEGRSVAGSPRRAAARRVLMTTQVALAVIVMVGASLLVRSLARLHALDLGFAKDDLVIARVVSSVPGDRSFAGYLTRFDTLRTRLLAIPGVVSVTPLDALPFSGAGGLDRPIARMGPGRGEAADHPAVNVEVVSEDFFGVFRIPVQRGRGFREADNANAPRVAVVNQSLALLLWSGDDPIEHAVRLGAATMARTVVGVVGDTRFRDLMTVRPTIYLPLRQGTGGPGYVALRTAADPASLVPMMRRAIDESGTYRAGRVATVEDLLAETLTQPRFSTFLLATFAIIAVVLAAVGLYSLLAEFVRQRTHEIGVRMALGASRGDARRMIVWEGMQVALPGIGLGLFIAGMTTRTLQAQLFEVAPADPLTLGAAAGLLLMIVAGACIVPAWRATRVDPTIALRTE